MFPDKIYYEPGALGYELGRMLKEKYSALPWIETESHNNIPELRQNANSEFAKMKRHLIIGIRKTHKYTENHKVSDYLVPYTSSGCSAMCLYCYLVCNYNKCSYMRLFVNREQMMDKLIKTADKSDKPLTFEIGSNSDLVLENIITGNLPWTIEQFTKTKTGSITFPTKFDMIEPLLPLDHKGKVIIRMSVNPTEIIRRIEFGTSSLDARIRALNQLCDADYKIGLLIAPIILTDDYKKQYSELMDILADTLSDKVKCTGFVEVIFMTYSFVHRAINAEAFPNAVQLYSQEKMTGRGMGKYCYRNSVRDEAEVFIKDEIEQKLKMPILYIV
ncbi:MAG: SPL family radical SAM protein [Eubacteriales bacterium]